MLGDGKVSEAKQKSGALILTPHGFTDRVGFFGILERIQKDYSNGWEKPLFIAGYVYQMSQQ